MIPGKQRLFSLDALRGFDMFWIMGADELFNEWNKTADSSILRVLASQLEHVEWNGFRFYDMIFPLFLFIAGVATPYSVGKQLEDGRPRKELLFRVIRRGLLLVLLGVIYNNGFKIQPIEFLRLPSVLGRIGLAYMFANIIYLYAGRKGQAIWFGSILIGYWLILALTSAPGFPMGDLSMQGNFASYVDRSVIPFRLYLGIHDPEGLFSALPAIGTGLLGIMTGTYLRKNPALPTRKALVLALGGIGFVLLAQMWNLFFPINKNLWTSSFACQAGGFSLLLLALFYYIIDVRGYQKWAFFFRVIGMNSILIYMSVVFIDWFFTATSLLGWIGQLTGPPYALVINIASVILVKWLFLYFLYRKKIFLRV